jgi:hypothetical protein
MGYPQHGGSNMAFSNTSNSTDAPPAVEYIGNGYRVHRDRARLLAETEGLPDDAFVTAKHAAALIDTSPRQLANWRVRRYGPPFVSGPRFVRYKIADLRAFMANRFRETQP